ncbi:MAG: insulinase family protein [Cyanobacteria bacterium HKST-UBA03]|nr:insulinase family protein [Cyanobacteria bacterium HKST-UBA03]
MSPMSPMVSLAPGLTVPSNSSAPALPITASSPGFSAPADAPSSRLTVSQPLSMPAKTMLANGVTAYMQQAPLAADCQLVVQLHTPFNSWAFNSMLSAMLVQGSPRTKALVNQLASRGVNVGTSSSPNSIALHLNGLKGQEASLVKWAQYLLTNPDVDPRTFQNLLQDTIKGQQEDIQQPEVQLSDAVHSVMYGSANPYTLSSTQTLRQLQQIRLGDVMAAFRSVLTRPEALRLTMNSTEPVAQQYQLLNTDWQYAPHAAYRQVTPEALPVVQYPVLVDRPKRVLVEKPDVKRAFVQKLWRAPKLGDPDYPAFMVLQDILGSQSWGFFRELRMRRELVYRANKNYSDIPQAHYYSVDFEVDFDKVQQGIDGLNTVVGDAMVNGVTPEQLQAAKKKTVLTMRQLIETNGGLNGLIDQYIDSGLPPVHPQQLLQDLGNVTLAQVQAVAHKVFGPANPSVLGVLAPRSVLNQL